jgi:hypothetical protein
MAIVSSTWIDEQDHLWVWQRPNTLGAEEKPKAAPPALEIDAKGNGMDRIRGILHTSKSTFLSRVSGESSLSTFSSFTAYYCRIVKNSPIAVPLTIG